MVSNLEHRAIVEVRAHRDTITGYAIMFDVRSRDLGGFVEVVRSQAVEATGDVVALFNHDPNAVLGRTPTTLMLKKDQRGLAFQLEPAPTQAGRDAFALVKRGDIRGASFGFRTAKDHWQRDDGVMVRELLAIELAEISLTAFPAYQQTDVSVAQRSLSAQRCAIHGATASISWLRLQQRVR